MSQLLKMLKMAILDGKWQNICWLKMLLSNLFYCLQMSVVLSWLILIFKFLGNFWNLFFKLLLLLQFFCDSHEAWHTRSMCQYTKKLRSRFTQFWFHNFRWIFEIVHWT